MQIIGPCLQCHEGSLVVVTSLGVSLSDLLVNFTETAAVVHLDLTGTTNESRGDKPCEDLVRGV